MELPSHELPKFTENSPEEALFHYTTAEGLLGILKNKQIWSTAYYCANDLSELSAGKGVITPIFSSKTHQLIQDGDSRVRVFANRGVDIWEYARKFEQQIISYALNFFCVYITCFCKPCSKEDFLHGLLSQWRGYGADGGYALQFRRERLQNRVNEINKDPDLNYELQDVYYSHDNSLKDKVTEHTDAFITAYLKHLDSLVNIDFSKLQMQSPLVGLPGGPLESLLEFLIHTKSSHFGEENECRLSALEPVSSELGKLPVDYLNRNGLIIPFTKTPVDFNILECIDWIIVGPGPRIMNRFNAVTQMVRKMGLNIKVRASHIPFTRA